MDSEISEKLPASHSVHSARPPSDAIWPIGHAEQLINKLVRFVLFDIRGSFAADEAHPFGHDLQVLAATTSENLPGAQLLQLAELLCCVALPGIQSMHAIDALDSANIPASQFKHSSCCGFD